MTRDAEGTTGARSRYARRNQRLRARLDDLTDILYGRTASELRGWQLREEVHRTLEALPKRERASWLAHHAEQLHRIVDNG